MEKINMAKMKFGLVLVFALLMIGASLSLVSAAKTYNFNVRYAIIEPNGFLNSTSTPILGVTSMLYACTAANCTTVGSAIGTFTTSTSVISIVFPETMPTAYGYVVYTSKDGYIGWEQSNMKISGNGTVNGTSTFNMSQMRTGSAPIDGLIVDEAVPQGRPIRVGFNVSIDANTHAAIQKNTVSNVALAEQVQTKVWVEIRNSAGNLIHSEVRTINIPYSGTAHVDFDYTGFNSTGVYNVTVFSNVTDLKILSPQVRSTSHPVNVIPQNLTNYRFTLLNNLTSNPAQPTQNQNTQFCFEYKSAYVNQSGFEFPANTIADITVLRGSTQIWASSVGLNSTGVYCFSRTFTDSGAHAVTVSGYPNDTRGNQSVIQPPLRLDFGVNVPQTNNTNQTSDDGNHGGTTVVTHNRNDGGTNQIDYESLPLTMPGNSTIMLGVKETSKAGYKVWFAWLLALTILLLIAVILIYVFKFVL